MRVFSYLQPRNTEAVENVIQHIQTQSQRSEDTRFQVDEVIAGAARQVFRDNLWKNQLVSNVASSFGILGTVGVITSLITVFYSKRNALYTVMLSAACLKLYTSFRNREGYRLDQALMAGSDEDLLRQLSLGANIDQSIWPIGDAAPGLLQTVMGSPRTLYRWLAERGKCEALAYALMLEPDVAKRAELAKQAISFSENIMTVQLLWDFGARPKFRELSLLCAKFGVDELRKIHQKTEAPLIPVFSTMNNGNGS